MVNASTTVAALFVDEGGVYDGLPDVEVWGITRDARLYSGPHPVVAHPPCERWGRYAGGSPRWGRRFTPGDDGGCFASALESVLRWGGILEHPAQSRAFRAHGLASPERGGYWWPARDDSAPLWVAWTHQGSFGHRAVKPTWLLATGRRPDPLPWDLGGPRPRGVRADGRLQAARGDVENLSKRQRRATPPAFRDLLLAIARDPARRAGR